MGKIVVETSLLLNISKNEVLENVKVSHLDNRIFKSVSINYRVKNGKVCCV